MADGNKKSEPPKEARFINPEGRSKVVPLAYPVEVDVLVDGEMQQQTWTEITVSRVTGKQVQEYIKKLADGENVLPPVLHCPPEVWDALDDDDQFTVDEEAKAFMPRRLKVAAEYLSKDGEST